MNDAAAPDDDQFDEEAPKRPSLPARAEAKAEAPRWDDLDELKLIAFSPAHEASGARETASASEWSWQRFKFNRLAAAASLTVVVAIGAAAAAAHVHSLRVARAEQAQAHAVTHRLDLVTTRLESLEAKNSHDDLASMRKVLAEIKSNTAGSRDVSSAVAQLSARVDRLEKEQGARLDKLGDRLDHDAAARLTEMSARLEKLEAKVSAPATVAVAKTPPAVVAVAKTPTPPPKPEVAKAAPPVSYEPTGAIDKSRTRLRNFYLADIRNGYAMIDSPAGEFAVGPGDMVPGGGRVLRIERRGAGWVVVTTLGQIATSDE